MAYGRNPSWLVRAFFWIQVNGGERRRASDKGAMDPRHYETRGRYEGMRMGALP